MGKESLPSSVWPGSASSSTEAVGPGLQVLFLPLLLLSEAGGRYTSPSSPQGLHLLLSEPSPTYRPLLESH